MSHPVRLCSKSQLPGEGLAAEFSLGDKMICVANVNGNYSAMDNVCLHRGGPLGQGTIENGKLVCPWHGWQFDVRTGAVVHNPSQSVRMYPISIQDDDVLVEIED